MDDETQRRMARNEALFRKVNEAIERGLWPGEEDEVTRFRCECARMDCQGVVELTVREYEEVRAHPRRFLLVEGHELPEVEAVVDGGSDHIVVQKLGEAGAEAEAIDPRS